MAHTPRRWILLAAACVAASAAPSATRAAAPVDLPERKLPAAQVDAAALGMAECPMAAELDARLVLAVCRGRAGGGSAGPLRLVVVDRSGGQARIAYEGPSAGDAYYVRPTVFQAEGGPALVLAEAGAEFSYGLDVYVIRPAGRIARAGTIALGAPGEDGPTSAAPFARVERRGDALCVAFTRDLVRGLPDGSYAKVARSRAQYVVRGARLTRARCPGAPR
jgi:hypothetical protein